MTAATEVISSRENALIKTLHKLAQDGGAYRKLGNIWLEGEHLVSSCLQKARRDYALGQQLESARLIVCQSYLPQLPHFLQQYGWQMASLNIVLIDDKLAGSISSLESAAPIGLLLPISSTPQTGLLRSNTVLLDRLQDPGNVGSILRSAAALGFTQVIALKGAVALWSPKVLRAGMGAHFSLQLIEQADAEDLRAQLQALDLPLLATSSHQGDYLHQARLPQPCAWVLGHEGQGVSAFWQAAAAQHIRIWQASEESFNVAAAAAVCLHASASLSTAANTIN